MKNNNYFEYDFEEMKGNGKKNRNPRKADRASKRFSEKEETISRKKERKAERELMRLSNMY